MNKYDAIIFDFDGVLVESVDIKTRAFAAIYEPYGPEIVREVIAYHLQHGGLSRFDKFRYWHEVLLGKRLNKEEERELGEQFSKLVVDYVVTAPWTPGSEEFLERFYKEIPFFVVSGTPDEEIKNIIHRRKMTHYFVSVHGTPSSKYKIIDNICIQHGLDRKRVLMIGDAMADYEGATLAGVSFIGRSQDVHNNIFPNDVTVINSMSVLHLHINN